MLACRTRHFALTIGPGSLVVRADTHTYKWCGASAFEPCGARLRHGCTVRLVWGTGLDITSSDGLCRGSGQAAVRILSIPCKPLRRGCRCEMLVRFRVSTLPAYVSRAPHGVTFGLPRLNTHDRETQLPSRCKAKTEVGTLDVGDSTRQAFCVKVARSTVIGSTSDIQIGT
jgi:hypothetical protein